MPLIIKTKENTAAGNAVQTVIRRMSPDEVWERQDAIDNAVHRLIEELTGDALDWNIEIIADVRRAIAEQILKHDLLKGTGLYPGADDEDDGDEGDDRFADRASLSGAYDQLRADIGASVLSFFALIVVLVFILLILPLLF